MEVVYTWDGKDFKDYGVRVSSSQGLIGGLKPKSGLEVQWSDEHGSVADRSQMYFEGRTIVLNCFLAADGAEDFIDRIGAFTALFLPPGRACFACRGGRAGFGIPREPLRCDHCGEDFPGSEDGGDVFAALVRGSAGDPSIGRTK